MTRNIFLEIHPNGYILLSERLTLKLKCPMHLRYYPFDLQICPIRAESYAFREDQVSEAKITSSTLHCMYLRYLKYFKMSYSWNDNSQIGINEQISLPTFKLKEYLVRPECARTFSTGNFSCFEGYLLLTRRISYYLIHIFFPSTLCVIVSWTAFWIKEQFARLMVHLTSDNRRSAPEVRPEVVLKLKKA